MNYLIEHLDERSHSHAQLVPCMMPLHAVTSVFDCLATFSAACEYLMQAHFNIYNISFHTRQNKNRIMSGKNETYIDLEHEVEREEGLEEQLEHDWEREDLQKFASEVLFCVQGLGSIRAVETETGKIETYIKGTHCEASLKDLCRFCKNDDPSRPVARLCMAKWRVVQQDLLNLLLCYPQDKVLTYYVVMLLESLTSPLALENAVKAQERDELRDALQDYKACFLRPMVLETLMSHFADCVQLEERLKVHNQMIELIVLIMKNLLQIPDLEGDQVGSVAEVRKNLQRSLIEMMIKESVVSGLNYMSQDFKSPLMKKLSISLTEIYYRLFTAFDPEWLLRDNREEKQHYLKFLQQEQINKARIMSKVPARHSRFSGLYRQQRAFDKSSVTTSTPFDEKKPNINPHQRHKPFLRAFIRKHPTIFVKRLQLNNDDQQKPQKEQLQILAIDFLQHCFTPLVEAVEDEIARDSERIEPNDKIHYFVLIAYFLKFTRLYCHKNKANNQSELSAEYVYVSAALQLKQFELLYANMLRECTHLRKRNINLRNYFAVTNTLLEFLHVVKDLATSHQQVDRKNAHILMQNIFQHDISKALRIGFSFCQMGLFGDDLLRTLIQLTSLFYDMLEQYSHGKVLSIKTNKVLKRKVKQLKKQQKRKQEEEIQEENQQEEGQQEAQDEEQEQDEDDDDEDEEEEQGPLYRERKFNFMSEFAVVVEYQIIEKLFTLLQGDMILTNSTELNNAICRYFNRIVDLLKADWLFFQVDFLCTINSLLQRTDVLIRGELRNLVTVFRKIARSFIATLQKNQLLSVEVLFRFTDSKLKDSILCNYEDELNVEQPVEQQQEQHQPPAEYQERHQHTPQRTPQQQPKQDDHVSESEIKELQRQLFDHGEEDSEPDDHQSIPHPDKYDQQKEESYADIFD